MLGYYKMEIDIIRKIKKISLDDNHRFSFIAKYIIENITTMPETTITDLAKLTYSSPSTINRFTKFLHLSGYKELIHILKYSNYALVESEETQNQSEESSLLDQKYQEVKDSIEGTFKLFLAQEEISKVVIDKIKAAKTINIFAMGGTYNLANDFRSKLLRLGFNVNAVNNYHDGYFLVKQSNQDIFNIFISYSGETKDLIALAEICQENNSQTLAITKQSSNSLNKITDFKLGMISNDPMVRIISLSNRLGLLFCLDMLLYKILFTDFEYYKELLQKTALNKF